MIQLSHEQVAFILEDLKANGIHSEELQLSLLDHICCMIEEEMSPEQDFVNFYQKVVPRFFKRDLLEIQEETDFLLTFKHYYAIFQDHALAWSKRHVAELFRNPFLSFSSHLLFWRD